MWPRRSGRARLLGLLLAPASLGLGFLALSAPAHRGRTARAASLYGDLLGPLIGDLGPRHKAWAEQQQRAPGRRQEGGVAPECGAEPEGEESNRALVENVRAPGRAQPSPKARYDLVVLGAGVAGLISCIVARQLGRSVAMVERHYTGGDCLNTGCVPSKALIAAARQVALVKESKSFGVSVGDVTVDFAAVMARMRRIRAEISEHDSVRRYTEEVGVDVFTGAAKFTGSNSVDIEGGPILNFQKCMVATGASARVPAELSGVEHLTSANLWNLTSLPPRLLVLGSGPIGLEIAQAMQNLGSQVTVVSQSESILGKEEPEAQRVVLNALERSGVKFLFSTRILGVERSDGPLYEEPFGTYSVELSTGSIEVDAILNATGRVPNTSSLGLEQAGVDVQGDLSVAVNSSLRTSNPNIFAAGDCLAGPNQFTHAAEWQARAAVRNAFLREGIDARQLLVPRATYTEPEVASVGRTAQELLAAGAAFETFTREAKDVDRNRCDGVREGFASLHVAPDGEILGATVVAPQAGDVISEVTLCMQHKITAERLAGTMHPYPTGAEIVRQAAQAFVRSRIYAPGSQALLATLSEESPHVRAGREGGLLTLDLSRPEALNACDVAMAKSLAGHLEGARAFGVLLAGEGAFCAGGDVKALASALREDKTSSLPTLQLTHEYRSIQALYSLSRDVPVVTLADGICMGYGLGLMAASSFRVVTEETVLAMPECGIGIVPDAGFSYFAAKHLPAGVGLCMALTGWQMLGEEALALGLATHYVRHEDVSKLRPELKSGDLDHRSIGELIDSYGDFRLVEECAPFLDELVPKLQAIFNAVTCVEDVKLSLRHMVGTVATADLRNWALERLEGVEKGCPEAQEACLHVMQAAQKDLETARHGDESLCLQRALEREYSAMSVLLRKEDFLEGVRAKLDEKDYKPEWSCRPQDLPPNAGAAVLRAGREYTFQPA